jgi:hypothetical protein
MMPPTVVSQHLRRPGAERWLWLMPPLMLEDPNDIRAFIMQKKGKAGHCSGDHQNDINTDLS